MGKRNRIERNEININEIVGEIVESMAYTTIMGGGGKHKTTKLKKKNDDTYLAIQTRSQTVVWYVDTLTPGTTSDSAAPEPESLSLTKPSSSRSRSFSMIFNKTG